MSKNIYCPKCSSTKMKLHIPQTNIWRCGKCRYIGPVYIEDINVENELRETSKIGKLGKTLFKLR